MQIDYNKDELQRLAKLQKYWQIIYDPVFKKLYNLDITLILEVFVAKIFILKVLISRVFALIMLISGVLVLSRAWKYTCNHLEFMM